MNPGEKLKDFINSFLTDESPVYFSTLINTVGFGGMVFNYHSKEWSAGDMTKRITGNVVNISHKERIDLDALVGDVDEFMEDHGVDDNFTLIVVNNSDIIIVYTPRKPVVEKITRPAKVMVHETYMKDVNRKTKRW